MHRDRHACDGKAYPYAVTAAQGRAGIATIHDCVPLRNFRPRVPRNQRTRLGVLRWCFAWHGRLLLTRQPTFPIYRTSSRHRTRMTYPFQARTTSAAVNRACLPAPRGQSCSCRFRDKESGPDQRLSDQSTTSVSAGPVVDRARPLSHQPRGYAHRSHLTPAGTARACRLYQDRNYVL